jgi:hypothetical protein
VSHGYWDVTHVWPPDCSVRAPDSARALAAALERVVAQQHAGTLSLPPRGLADGSLKYQEEILTEVLLEKAAAATAAPDGPPDSTPRQPRQLKQ